jgi:hypothetical protein
LHADLQNQGVRYWFAPHDVQAAKKLHEQVYEAIRLYDRLLLILSEHSMNSEWFRTEIAHAKQKELDERRQVLFPISTAGGSCWRSKRSGGFRSRRPDQTFQRLTESRTSLPHSLEANWSPKWTPMLCQFPYILFRIRLALLPGYNGFWLADFFGPLFFHKNRTNPAICT